MGRITKQKELVVTNSEKYHAEKWDALFKVLRGRIERVWKTGPGQHQYLSAIEIEDFRGCISALTVFQFNQTILLEKLKDLLAVVGDICAYGRSNIDTTPPSLIALLEIFIKEALAHPIVRRLLDPSRQRILEVSGSPSIQELLLAHLYLSFPKNECLNFTDSFCRSLAMSNASNDGRSYELGLWLGIDSTLALLNTSFSSPMPYLLQAHMAIFTSRCIETQNSEQAFGLGFDRAISAFELSAKLYWRSLRDLDLGQRSRPYIGRSAKKSHPNQAPNRHMDEMMFLLRPTKPGEVAQKDLFLQVSSYIDETQQIMHESSSLKTGDALKGIVSMLLSDKELGKKRIVECTISEELVSLVALASLMASSLFRVVTEARAMIGRAPPGRRETDLPLEGKLMSFLDLKTDAGWRLVGRNADKVVRKIFLDAISVGSSNCKRRSLLLMQHFLKLMLLGLRARMDFLWKVCVSVLSAIMNLMAFEGEEFDALKILAGDACEPVETTKGLTCKRKSKEKQLDASVLPNAKRQCLIDDLANSKDSHQSKDCIHDSQVLLEKRIPEVCAHISDNENLVDFFKHPPEDLVDFVDYSPDMDLPCWLREREGLFTKRQAAQKKKRKMLRRLLGINI